MKILAYAVLLALIGVVINVTLFLLSSGAILLFFID